ncbi:MAG TPA: sensor domain-containing diguanylate cyclase [candidate division Zixibacteria bacterium]|nr:sensor domain-containing diguanylate cyclase [candidate division Zixibacteria bacterium]
MKLFLDRHKTLLPRIDTIYLLARIIVLVGIAWFTLVGNYEENGRIFFYAALGTFVLHLGFFYWAMKGHFDIKLAYLSSVIYDLLLIPTIILYTGGYQSSFFLLFYLTIAIAAYVLTLWFASVVTLLVCGAYIAVIFPDLNMSLSFDVALRVGLMVVSFLTIHYASDYMRRSEKRLLKLFNTLNMRTSELEKSQALIEMIYENTRILASILDANGVVKEVARIMGDVLEYECYSMIIHDKGKDCIYRIRAQGNRPNFQLKRVPEEGMGLVAKICELGESVRLKDVRQRNDYKPLSETARSVMIVPLVTHGAIKGVLTTESDEIDAFGDKDVQLLSVVARSAALALDNAELHRKTEELTIIDELTQAYNYRYFVQKLEEEQRRAVRYDLPLSLVMVDIDWFKRLNDTFGHEHGNKVLSTLSGIIKQCIRDVDIFARYGGEEFVIILPQTPLAEATQIGERIRAQVEAAGIDLGAKEPVHITVSVGVSSYPENGKSHEELISIADKALYRAKDEGRNLVCVM